MKKELGSSLLEVMIGLFVLAIGLLGMANLQSRAMQQNSTAFQYSQALFLVEDLVERVRANRTAMTSYKTKFSESQSTGQNCKVGACDADQIAQWDLANWKADVSDLLPQGRGQVDVLGRVITVSIEFDDSRGEEQASIVKMSTEI